MKSDLNKDDSTGTEVDEWFNDIAKSDVYIDNSAISVGSQIPGLYNQSNHPNVHMITKDVFRFDLAQLHAVSEKTIRCIYFKARGQAWSDGMDIVAVDDSGAKYNIGGTIKEQE